MARDERESELMGLRSTAKGIGVVGPVVVGDLAGWKLVESREGVVFPGQQPVPGDD